MTKNLCEAQLTKIILSSTHDTKALHISRIYSGPYIQRSKLCLKIMIYIEESWLLLSLVHKLLVLQQDMRQLYLKFCINKSNKNFQFSYLAALQVVHPKNSF